MGKGFAANGNAFGFWTNLETAETATFAVEFGEELVTLEVLEFVVIVKRWQTVDRSGIEDSCCSSSSSVEKREIVLGFPGCARHRDCERESDNAVGTEGAASFLLDPCEHSRSLDSGSSCCGYDRPPK